MACPLSSLRFYLLPLRPGQTGSGKTFTMMGSNLTGMKAGNQDENICEANLGLYFLAAQDVFHLAQDPQYEDISINCSIDDLLKNLW